MKRLDTSFILCSLLTAVIAFAGGEVLMALLYGVIPNVLLMALYFGICGFIILLFTHICVFFYSPLQRELPSKSLFGKSVLLLAVPAMLLLLFLGGLFQFLYTTEFTVFAGKESFIIAVDNSGSMEQNDPDYQRYEALRTLFDTVEARIGVFVFADDYTNVFPVKNIQQSDRDSFDVTFGPYKVSGGGTEVDHLLNGMADYVSSGLAGSTNVVLISDGECDVSDQTLQRLAGMKLPVHTIGVKDKGANDSLAKIAHSTGGQFYPIDDVTELSSVFTGITAQSKPWLLTEKRSESVGMRPALLHVLFIVLLAAVVKLFELLTVDISRLRPTLLAQCIGFSAIAGVSAELLFEHTASPGWLVRLLTLLLISLLILTYLENVKTTVMMPRTSAAFGGRPETEQELSGSRKALK